MAPASPRLRPRRIPGRSPSGCSTLLGLGPDGQPRAGRIEHGDVLDRAGPERVHPILQGKAISFELLDVVFLREDEALIQFEVQVSSGPTPTLPGRVVRGESRWLLSYDTVARLRQMGGDPVPSLLDHPGADEGPPLT